MKIVETINDLKNTLDPIRKNNTIAFVPTMGALHDGHASILKTAIKENDYTVLSIYVNPKQFTPNEDFHRYPRPFEKDIEQAFSLGVNLVFHPTNEVIYPKNFYTNIKVSKLTEKLCAKKRPYFFDGVTTVVARLFGLVQPNRAYFGEKDMQQYLIIQQMTTDMNFPIEIKSCPTVREEDGLALSSRNQYLSKEEREKATALYQALCLIQKQHQEGEREVKNLVEAGKKLVHEVKLEYLEILSYPYLEELKKVDTKAICAIAAELGTTRLIDNIVLE